MTPMTIKCASVRRPPPPSSCVSALGVCGARPVPCRLWLACGCGLGKWDEVNGVRKGAWERKDSQPPSAGLAGFGAGGCISPPPLASRGERRREKIGLNRMTTRFDRSRARRRVGPQSNARRPNGSTGHSHRSIRRSFSMEGWHGPLVGRAVDHIDPHTTGPGFARTLSEANRWPIFEWVHRRSQDRSIEIGSRRQRRPKPTDLLGPPAHK